MKTRIMSRFLNSTAATPRHDAITRRAPAMIAKITARRRCAQKRKGQQIHVVLARLHRIKRWPQKQQQQPRTTTHNSSSNNNNSNSSNSSNNHRPTRLVCIIDRHNAGRRRLLDRLNLHNRKRNHRPTYHVSIKSRQDQRGSESTAGGCDNHERRDQKATQNTPPPTPNL